MNLRIRQARDGDLERVTTLLQEGGLPTLGVREHFERFLLAEDGDRVVGTIGLEAYDNTGLLRSAVVEAGLRGKGVGTLLYSHLLAMARSMGIRKLVLLTNTAESYFAAKGFRSIDRATLTGPVTTSVEFTDACPSHAVCMELLL
jgi:amino-acid N-acetyltransferase